MMCLSRIDPPQFILLFSCPFHLSLSPTCYIPSSSFRSLPIGATRRLFSSLSLRRSIIADVYECQCLTFPHFLSPFVSFSTSTTRQPLLPLSSPSTPDTTHTPLPFLSLSLLTVSYFCRVLSLSESLEGIITYFFMVLGVFSRGKLMCFSVPN